MKRSVQEKRNRIKRLFNDSDAGKVNCVRGSSAESFSHWSRKCELAYWCFGQGHKFLSEARLKLNGRRVDFVCLDTGIVFEVVAGESVVSVLAKKVVFGDLDLGLVFVDAYKEFDEGGV